MNKFIQYSSTGYVNPAHIVDFWTMHSSGEIRFTMTNQQANAEYTVVDAAFREAFVQALTE